MHADELPGEVAAALAAAGLPPRLLTLCFSEEVLQTSSATLVPALHTVHDAGVQLALTGYGMGSTLWSQLSRVPLDVVIVASATSPAAATPARRCRCSPRSTPARCPSACAPSPRRSPRWRRCTPSAGRAWSPSPDRCCPPGSPTRRSGRCCATPRPRCGRPCCPSSAIAPRCGERGRPGRHPARRTSPLRHSGHFGEKGGWRGARTSVCCRRRRRPSR
ncbi:hypothetical protein A7K94_0220250 [Modestobacter sp. VKM Ac-2676]|nr:hypothetical protein A7K94_0220250 [Modestobacter sp. VKM Ac-2676]